MPSVESQALREIYETRAARMAAIPKIDLATLRSLYEEEQLCSAEPAGVTYENIDAGGIPSIWVSPVPGPSIAGVILYFHGGGFMVGSPSGRRKVLGHVCRAANTQALIVKYRRTPEHEFPAAQDDGLAAYRWLLEERRVPSSAIVFMGDSAGGNLALTLALRVRGEGLPLPGAVVAFSPWTNLENSFPSMDTNDALDHVAHRPVLDEMAAAYVGSATSLRNPLVSAVHADLRGFPPLYVTVGTHETLQDDSIELVRLARAAGVAVEFELAEGQQHVHLLMAGRAPEADKSIANVGAWLKRQLKSM
ncbi:hypothetical protein P175DRAFT_0523229 [Aspergillus ochraceoroseus IBT 24754]|uniref:Alpha/beta hydrolase fold-3 domain-containing protein n=3 Tax=Aspergillus subgen. Nidulantes TaxID=2720870 RepID=A0A0F8USF0_9EURO|nr:uncharacterized protein P175DRAFT_0523229 [Aspergillus ochraceoroseus IBT 24754]KKK18892.1 hypothetical protein AOCH_001828 [Aspergillus ochraceoroseus]KKK22398.1 hypothetical protein ARAM_002226 [Aspergillus rambellii]PTU22054.1 hypothetical protein P175DRAFT_0523229 [Aspergillus ochraceoroseus IBT 24754]